MKIPSTVSDMGIMRKWHRWSRIMLAALVYFAANVFDYLLTVYGVNNNLSQEANPVANGYIYLFGLERGLLLFKVLLGSFIIAGVFVFELVCENRGVKARSEFILYGASILTVLAGSLWLTQF